MIYQSYAPSDAAAVVDIWNACLGDDFPLDMRLWAQNVDLCPWTYAPGCWLAVDDAKPHAPAVAGFVIAKSPGNIAAIAVHSEHRRRGIGRELLRRAVVALRSPDASVRAAEKVFSGKPPTNLVTGQDMHHFFPGVPETQSEAFAFFTACGWTRVGNWGYDLWRDLDGFAIAPDVQARIVSLAEAGVELRSCREADVPALIAFLEAEFAGGWLYGAKRRLEVEPDASETKIAVRDGAVIAFAQIFSPRSARLGPSVAWRELLGSQFGGLGPMGVAVEARGLGVGLALLAFSVAEVQKTGATRMAIDWTEHLDFYARLGFTPWKRYGAFSLPIAG